MLEQRHYNLSALRVSASFSIPNCSTNGDVTVKKLRIRCAPVLDAIFEGLGVVVAGWERRQACWADRDTRKIRHELRAIDTCRDTVNPNHQEFDRSELFLQ